METVIIFTLFVCALLFIGQNAFKALFSKQKAGCAKGCGSCGSIDFEEVLSKTENKSSVPPQ